MTPHTITVSLVDPTPPPATPAGSSFIRAELGVRADPTRVVVGAAVRVGDVLEAFPGQLAGRRGVVTGHRMGRWAVRLDGNTWTLDFSERELTVLQEGGE